MDVSCVTSANPMALYNNPRTRYHRPQDRLVPSQPYDDDTSSSDHLDWEKYRQLPQNENRPSFYMDHYHRPQYYYTDSENNRTAPLSLIYNTNDFLETVESPLFIESSGNRHQQTNITTNKESFKQNPVSSSIKEETMLHDPSLLNNDTNNASAEGSTLKKKETKDNHKYPIVAERKRQRRESHNAVERRRRNNINDNIRLLGELLPENICQGKQNKGSILKGSVLYIRMLNDQLLRYKERVERLEYETVALQSAIQ